MLASARLSCLNYFQPRFKPPSHQTCSYYVLKNVAERAQTVWERSERSSNFLRSVYELHGRSRSGSDGKGAPERRPCPKYFSRHPVLQLDGVTTYKTRWTYYAQNCLGLLRSSYGRVMTWCSRASLGSTFVCTPTRSRYASWWSSWWWSQLAQLEESNGNEELARMHWAFTAVEPGRDCRHLLHVLGTRWGRSVNEMNGLWTRWSS